ncbi:type II toxin-antitoxin system VapC family toxin [Fibrisoma montanum]|uniref:Type II toxin-antitoxin system VapC family toxin n=1 Tax=Fibrisoma montanum TaxID=2305895 RepID=A0A418MB34_9BACT|nr:type II toxin-antitoxin system VapC family toxin [Fibrisoma montanum]RIV23583.1 type II toxin-antitoxin system VapC family toxin [Fibrisoma montanum]
MILDSNIIIYFVDPAYAKLRAYLRERETTLHVSLISKLEVLGYHKLKATDKVELERLLGAASILPITDDVVDEAIRLRQQRKRSIGDSIIAATGLLYNLPVLTNNIDDFIDIPGLQVIALTSLLTPS